MVRYRTFQLRFDEASPDKDSYEDSEGVSEGSDKSETWSAHGGYPTTPAVGKGGLLGEGKSGVRAMGLRAKEHQGFGIGLREYLTQRDAGKKGKSLGETLGGGERPLAAERSC